MLICIKLWAMLNLVWFMYTWVNGFCKTVKLMYVYITFTLTYITVNLCILHVDWTCIRCFTHTSLAALCRFQQTFVLCVYTSYHTCFQEAVSLTSILQCTRNNNCRTMGHIHSSHMCIFSISINSFQIIW